MLTLRSIVSMASRSLMGPTIRLPNSIRGLQNVHISPKRHMSTVEGETNGDPESDGLTDDEAKIFDREFVDMAVVDFESLYKDDHTGSTKSQIETILKEYEYLKYNSLGRVPSLMNCDDMSRIISEALTPASREKMFNYLFKREMVKRSAILKKQKEKEDKKAELDEKFAEMDRIYGAKTRTGLLSQNGQLIYGLWHNSLLCRIPENRLKFANSEARLIEAALFGKKLVFDFDFEQYMSNQTSRSVVEQIQESYGLNRYQYQEPFDLWFCNFDESSRSCSFMSEKILKNLYNGSMITIKNDCFTKHFDKSRLVYLSPDAKQPLTDVGSNDDVYIIGVFNDKGASKPLTYRKAENLGIRSRSLPLDTFLAWQGGSKSLCLNHVTAILLELVANGGDWRKALLKSIPSRKIKPIEVVMQEEERRLAKRKNKFNIRHDFDF